MLLGQEAIRNQNELVNVKTYPFFLTPDNAEEIIGNYDFIVDAADNFETKFLINDTCVLLKKPFCHAGIIGSIQALEAVKYVLGAGQLLTGRLLVFDGLSMNMRVIRFEKKNPQCRVCGDKKDIDNIKGYAREYMKETCQLKSSD